MTHTPTQHVVPALLAAALLGPATARAQSGAGAQLWTAVHGTLPVPAALAAGGAASFWNPAQSFPADRVVAGLELVQTSSAVGAAGFLAAAHLRLPPLGTVGLAYGRMGVNDLDRTETTPEPTGSVPYYATTISLSATRTERGTTAGIAVRLHSTRVDAARSRRVAVDAGVRQRVGRLRFAVATHDVAGATRDVPGRFSAAVALELWHGEAWTGSAESSIELRYGAGFTSGLPADHLFGLGLALGRNLDADALLAREGGYGTVLWRPVGGVRLRVGRYQVTLAGDSGLNGLGPAFRVGLETRVE